MIPRSLLLNTIALVGLVGWMAGAPKLVFGSEAGAVIQPTPPPAAGQPPTTPSGPRFVTTDTRRDGTERVVEERPGQARLIHVTPPNAEREGGGACAQQAETTNASAKPNQPYYVVEARVYDRKTGRIIPGERRVIRAEGYSDAATLMQQHQFGVWDNGTPLTAAEFRALPR